ncbi:MAG: hypothetical protein RJA13_2172 [Bacteroidota bacterium]
MEGLGYIFILSVVGTALAVIVFNQIISYSSALFASGVTYFIPIVAVLIGVGFGEERCFYCKLLAAIKIEISKSKIIFHTVVL